MREYLKQMRERANLSQEEVADVIGLSRAYYSRVESGERQKDLNLSLVIRLSEALDVSVDRIIAEEDRLKQMQNI